jgi:hypothetical protein
MTRYLAYGFAGLVALAASFGAGRLSAPTRVETKTEFVERVREVRSTQIQRVVDTKWNRVTVTTPGPAGPTVTVTETAVVHEDSKTHENAETEKASETKTVTIKVTDAPRLTISVLLGVQAPNSWSSLKTLTPTYGIHAQYRVLGPVVIGGWFSTPTTFGVSTGLTF